MTRTLLAGVLIAGAAAVYVATLGGLVQRDGI